MSEASGEDAGKPSIFVSYRHVDAAKDVENLKKTVLALRSDVRVFIDRDASDGVVGGENWPERLRSELQESRLVLLVIGPRWLVESDKWGRRLIDQDEDWCRQEVAVALADQKELLPIVVRGAELPPSDALPESIRELDLRQALTFDNEEFGDFVERLGKSLDRVFGATAPVAVEGGLKLVARYRGWLEGVHNRETWSLPGVRRQFIEDVFVAIDVGVERRGPRSEHDVEGEPTRHFETRRVSLRELMSGEGASVSGSAWAVLGEPGAGKTTLARHLTLELAETAGEGVLPVYLPLPRMVDEGGDVAALFRVTQESAGVEGLAELLRARARDVGQQPVWFLLDGLDEVAPAHLGELRARLTGWVGQLPNARFAVFSRTIGFHELGAPFRTAVIQPLSSESRQALVGHWADPDLCGRVLAHLEAHPAVGKLAGNPLMLTLIAQLAASGQSFPANRVELYDRAIDLLIERPQAENDGARIRAATQVREVLGGLCLELQHESGSAWDKKTLIGALRRAGKLRPEIRDTLQDVWGGDRDAFLEDLARKTGLIEPDPTTGKVWTFAHRQFREFLAAEALSSVPGGWQKVVGELADDAVPRWSETLGLLCGLADDPMQVLELLRARSVPAFVKALPDVEGVAPDVLASLLWDLEPRIEGWSWSPGQESPYHWDGDDLAESLAAWVGQARWSAVDAVDWLWTRVVPSASTTRLAWLHWALAKLGEGDDERFFRECQRPQPEEDVLDWIPIPSGEFRMGSPTDEVERFDDEGPSHDVAIEGFELSKYAVTNAQYGRFAGDHEAESFGGRVAESEVGSHPVVNVSWWESYLYCAWSGCRLPTESEWEYACRAGTEGPFSFEGDLSPDRVNYDGNYPYAGGAKGEYRERTVAVGELAPNGWGLHEMHGNVREWCEDRWHESYAGAPEDGSAWWSGSDRRRVLRGGSWYDYGRSCRSAFRFRDAPGFGARIVGFRPARSSD